MHCSHSPFSVAFNKRVKARFFIGKTLITPLREAVDGVLECRGYQHTSESFKKELQFEMSDASGPQIAEVLESVVG